MRSCIPRQRASGISAGCEIPKTRAYASPCLRLRTVSGFSFREAKHLHQMSHVSSLCEQRLRFGPLGLLPYRLDRLHDGDHPVGHPAGLDGDGPALQLLALRVRPDAQVFSAGGVSVAVSSSNSERITDDSGTRMF